MPDTLSPRLREIVDALPLRTGMRVLEIGCGPGAAARAVAHRIGNGHVLAIDRSAKAIAQAIAGSSTEIADGRLSFRQVSAEEFALLPAEAHFDLAFAVRVGVLDGRHPRDGIIARRRIAAALSKDGSLYIDGGEPLLRVDLAEC